MPIYQRHAAAVWAATSPPPIGMITKSAIQTSVRYPYDIPDMLFNTFIEGFILCTCTSVTVNDANLQHKSIIANYSYGIVIFATGLTVR